MKYTIFIFTVLYVCLMASRAASASESLKYELESCNKTLTESNPIESYMGKAFSVAVGAEGLEELTSQNSSSFVLRGTKEHSFDTAGAKVSYSANTVSVNSVEVNLVEQGITVDKNFDRTSGNHKININVIDGSIVIDWVQTDLEWDNYFTCTYKPEVVTAKN